MAGKIAAMGYQTAAAGTDLDQSAWIPESRPQAASVARRDGRGKDEKRLPESRYAKGPARLRAPAPWS